MCVASMRLYRNRLALKAVVKNCVVSLDVNCLIITLVGQRPFHRYTYQQVMLANNV